ncbi:MAG: nuclease, partial [Akkermansiaceae bacterium]|nr:nuclease [Akkermansiaceae bacterium]
DTITDFTPGVDKINLQGVLDNLGYTGSDPLSDGTIQVLDSPKGAQVQINSNGSYRTLIVLQGLTTAQAPKLSDLLF